MTQPPGTGQGDAPATSGKWDDLRARVLSSIGMVALGIFTIVMGGVWFQMLAVFVTAVMVWELWMMISPDRPAPGMLMAALVASVFSGFLSTGNLWVAALFGIVPVIGALAARRERLTFFVFALGIQLAGWGLVIFRDEFGVTLLLWLVGVVIATDIAGYFAGKALGGPKFWPAVSPKKTWSGTAAGWVGAGLVGLGIVLAAGASWVLVPLSMVLSFAGQMGDIAESALKRRQGVKDSSSLIPGHGGLFDRFDALLGAALFLLILVKLFDLPGVVF